MIEVIRLPESDCPGCGKKLDSATNLTGGSGIDRGDYSVCIRCGTLLRYDQQLHVKKATKTELGELKSRNISAYLKLMKASVFIREKN
jgi:hypothetical protein